MKQFALVPLLLAFGFIAHASSPVVNGYVKDKSNGETLIGATVMVKGTTKGTACNAYGFYSLAVSSGRQTIVYSFMGYEPLEVEVDVQGATRLDVELSPANTQLEEVVVRAEHADARIRSTEMGVVRMSPATKTLCSSTRPRYTLLGMGRNTQQAILYPPF